MKEFKYLVSYKELINSQLMIKKSSVKQEFEPNSENCSEV